VDDLLEVGSIALRQGATGTVDLSLRSAMGGLAGARLTVSVTDPDVAEITGVSYSDGTALTREPRISADGTAVELAVADVEKAVQPGATNVTLGTIDLEGVDAGTTDLTIQVHRLDDEQGKTVETATKDGLVVTGPPAIGGGSGPGGRAPTDPDGDGLYEDVNGNGRMDYADIELLFENLDSDAVQLNKEAYDFNDNGQIDYDDVVELYDEQ
jgi:PKD repeat protein